MHDDEYSWKEVEWIRSGQAGPFDVYVSKNAHWYKLRMREPDGKTKVEFIITDREANDLRNRLHPF